MTSTPKNSIQSLLKEVNELKARNEALEAELQRREEIMQTLFSHLEKS